MNDFRRWTPTEEQYIHDHWRSQSDAEMAKALDRSEGAVRTKRRQLRCSPQKTWMPEDEEYLREAWGRVSIPGIAKHLDRTVNAVKVHVARLGLGAMLANGDYVTFNQLMLMEDYNNGNTQAGTLVETYLEEARALAEAQYDSSEAVRAQTDAENDMITAIRENTAALGGWKAQYDLSQNLTKGRAATWTATTQTTGTSSGTNTMIANGYGYANVVPRNAIGYAVGIDYVPYDNFPALLHQGEQVLTAEEARSGNGGSGGVQIIMNGVTIREDADIDRVAAALLQKMELAGMRG